MSDTSNQAPSPEQPSIPGGQFYHIQADTNCFAVADLVVVAMDEDQARRKAEQVFDLTRFQVTANTRIGARVYVSLQPENVEIHVLGVQNYDREMPPADEDAIRARVEAEMGRLVLLEMESLDTSDNNPQVDRARIQTGLRHRITAGFFEELWQLYQELHPASPPRQSRAEADRQSNAAASPEQPPGQAKAKGMRERLMDRLAQTPRR